MLKNASPWSYIIKMYQTVEKFGGNDYLTSGNMRSVEGNHGYYSGGGMQ